MSSINVYSLDQTPLIQTKDKSPELLHGSSKVWLLAEVDGDVTIEMGNSILRFPILNPQGRRHLQAFLEAGIEIAQTKEDKCIEKRLRGFWFRLERCTRFSCDRTRFVKSIRFQLVTPGIPTYFSTFVSHKSWESAFRDPATIGFLETLKSYEPLPDE